MSSLILQTAIGLTYIFAVFAVAVSAISEALSRYIGLRAEFLLRGIRSLVDGHSAFHLDWKELMPAKLGQHFVRQRARTVQQQQPEQSPQEHAQQDGGQEQTGGQPEALVARIMAHPLVASSAHQAARPFKAGDRAMSNADRRKLPSYLSGYTFARALLDLLVENAQQHGANAGQHGKDTVGLGEDPLEALRHWVKSESRRHDHLAGALRPLVTAAKDMSALETSIIRWYDDHMARVSGWYKRYVKWISLGIGLVLVVVFNVNAIRIADALYSDQALSASVVTEATRVSSCRGTDPAACLGDLRAEVGKIRSAGLPLGWADVPGCTTGKAAKTCSWLDRHGLTSVGKNGSADVWTFLLVLLGWAVMMLALLPGARFWFDLLSRLGSLRSTGPKPAR